MSKLSSLQQILLVVKYGVVLASIIAFLFPYEKNKRLLSAGLCLILGCFSMAAFIGLLYICGLR